MIIGQDNMAQNEVVIRVDDLLISDCALYDLDDAKAHFDDRSIYSQELGRAMARALRPAHCSCTHTGCTSGHY